MGVGVLFEVGDSLADELPQQGKALPSLCRYAGQHKLLIEVGHVQHYGLAETRQVSVLLGQCVREALVVPDPGLTVLTRHDIALIQADYHGTLQPNLDTL